MKACPYCTARLQRTIDGTELDGLRAHIETVHPELAGRPLPAGYDR